MDESHKLSVKSWVTKQCIPYNCSIIYEQYENRKNEMTFIESKVEVTSGEEGWNRNWEETW